MLMFSMSASIDGFVNDRDGGFDWSAPDDELFRFHHAEVATLGAYLLGRRLYETMLVWENDPAVRESAEGAEFADLWTALPKVVFSRTLDSVQGKARLARGTVAEEVARALEGTDRDVSIGGADLAGQAIGLGLVDELRVYRCPVIAGGGTPHLPPLERQHRFELAETRGFATGVVYERYRRTTHD